ncbi:SulP family inorganic anion transporter [Candidatus Foliamicus sp.]
MNYDAQTFRGDVLGGVISAVVALPVALAFGIASGLGAAAGMYGAIAVGFFASVFGGTRSQISGPTPSMTIAMAVILSTHASTLAEALTVVVLAGLIQALLGILRIGRFVMYTPHIVVSGFMSGIGLIIMLIQLLPFVGAPTSPEGPMGALRALPAAIANINSSALVIAFLALGIMVFWPKRAERFAPGPLVALVAGSALGMLWLTDAPVIGDIPEGLPAPMLALPSASFLLDSLPPAILLALLGAVDSLLTSLIADSMTGTRHKPDKELVGQGLGNIVSGLFGGMPGAGATIGTVTNIRAGGSTPVSGVVRALFLLALLLGLGHYVEPIPHAVLAGILMKIGWDIIDWRLLLRIHRLRRDLLVAMLLTLFLTVVVDLVTAVAIGLIVAGMTQARQLKGPELDSVVSIPILDRTFFAGEDGMTISDPLQARVGMVALRGTLTVASSRNLASVIGADIREHKIVVFDFSDAKYLDDSAAMVIEQILGVARDSNTKAIMVGLSGAVEEMIENLGVLRTVPKDRVVADLAAARSVARKLLGE